jgi:hypothetical protein
MPGEETLGTRARNLSSYRERRKRVLGIVRVLAPSLSTLTHPFVVVYIHTGALVCFVVPLVYISPLQGRPGQQQHKIEMLFFFLDSSTPLPNEIFFFHQCPNKLFCLYIIDCVCVCVSISSGSVAKDSICTPAAASLLLLLLLRWEYCRCHRQGPDNRTNTRPRIVDESLYNIRDTGVQHYLFYLDLRRPISKHKFLFSFSYNVHLLYHPCGQFLFFLGGNLLW